MSWETKKITEAYPRYLIVVVSILVLYSWVAGNDVLKSFGNPDNYVTMKPSTAICFLFVGLSMFSEQLKVISTLAISYIMFDATVLKNLFGVTLMPVFTPDSDVLSVSSYTPSIMTLLCFLLCIFALNDFRRYSCGKIIMLICITNFIGYVVNSQLLQFYVEGISTAMALNTSILFMHIGAHFYIKRND